MPSLSRALDCGTSLTWICVDEAACCAALMALCTLHSVLCSQAKKCGKRIRPQLFDSISLHLGTGRARHCLKW